MTLPNRSVRSAVRFVVFFLVLRFIRLLVFWTILLFLLLLLFLLQLLLFLIVFVLRVHISRRIARIVWPHRRRAVVVDSRIAGIRGRIARLVAGFVDVLIRRRRIVLHNGRVCRFHLRLSGVARRSGPVRPIVVRHVAGPIGRNVLRLGRFCRRGDFHRNWCDLHALSLLLAYFRNRDGPAAIGSDGFLLLFEASWRWGRRRLGYHGAVLQHLGRPNSGRRAGAENSLFRRRPDGRCRGRNRSVGNIPLVDLDHVLANGLSGGEGLMGSGGHRAGNALVDILDVADADVVCVVGVVDHRGVVDVGDIRVVDRGVRYVHVIHVRAAYAIRRHVDLARPQREPRHTNATAPANSNPYGEVRAADPGHERGRVYRPNVSYFNHCRSWRARHPAPHTANDNPTSVMERREAPRLIVNPSPSPGRNPNPVDGLGLKIGRAHV